MTARQKTRPSVALAKFRDEIRTVVQAHKMANPRVFGSTISGTDTRDSDLDLLVEDQPGLSYFDIGRAVRAVRERFGIVVHLTNLRTVPESKRASFLANSLPL
jgi:predicted nucleotidyltransferase